MPYPDGTPTSDDLAEKAQQLMEPEPYESDSLNAAQLVHVDVMRGVGFALLAIHAEMQIRRAEGRG